LEGTDVDREGSPVSGIRWLTNGRRENSNIHRRNRPEPGCQRQSRNVSCAESVPNATLPASSHSPQLCMRAMASAALLCRSICQNLSEVSSNTLCLLPSFDNSGNTSAILIVSNDPCLPQPYSGLSAANGCDLPFSRPPSGQKHE